MKTLLLTLVALMGLGFTVPTAEARDGDRYRRYSRSDYHRHYGSGVRVYYRTAPRYYCHSGYGRCYYPRHVYSGRRYYRPGGLTVSFGF